MGVAGTTAGWLKRGIVTALPQRALLQLLSSPDLPARLALAAAKVAALEETGLDSVMDLSGMLIAPASLEAWHSVACHTAVKADDGVWPAVVSLEAAHMQCMGRYRQALPMLQRCLEARERTLGHEHPSTLAS